MLMEQQEDTNTIFSFETSDPRVVSITLSTLGKDKVDEPASVFEDLLENLDQNLRTAGYIYNIQLTDDSDGIVIKPFEDEEEFNQEVFNLIAEELDFMDKLLNDDSEDEELDL